MKLMELNLERTLTYAIAVLLPGLHILRALFAAHIFQLNSYKYRVHFRWMRKNWLQLFWKLAVLLLGILWAALVRHPILCRAGVLTSLVSALLINLPEKAKKPLVYTKRIVRMLITDAVLSLGAAAAIVFAVEDFRLRCVLGLACVVLSPLFLLLANLLNRPLETQINKRYMRDAKRLLASHKTLIKIGVTGSYGKTSVKFMLGMLLGAKYNVLVTPESYNTPLGVTRTVRESLRGTHDVFVCEMGAKNVGDIKELCELVHPDHGIITSIGPQHLESFKTLENVRKTKFELADALPPEGKLFLNRENENIRSFAHPHPAISYGFADDCDYRADDISVSAAGTSFCVHHGEEAVSFRTQLLGAHNVVNLLGAIAVCCELGIPMQKLPPYALRIEPVPHRLQLMKRGGATIIDDAYNANPSGVRAALDVLSLFDGCKIAVTPGMIELGSVQEQENYSFGARMAEVCDYVCLVGKKQTEPILQGLQDAGFPDEKIFVTDDLKEAAQRAFSMDTESRQRIVLFENDLPDNF